MNIINKITSLSYLRSPRLFLSLSISLLTSQLLFATDAPVRGMSQNEVLNQYGAPFFKSSAVGSPPISKWQYTDFTVYFENIHVIHSVKILDRHRPSSESIPAATPMETAPALSIPMPSDDLTGQETEIAPHPGDFVNATPESATEVPEGLDETYEPAISEPGTMKAVKTRKDEKKKGFMQRWKNKKHEKKKLRMQEQASRLTAEQNAAKEASMPVEEIIVESEDATLQEDTTTNNYEDQSDYENQASKSLDQVLTDELEAAKLASEEAERLEAEAKAAEEATAAKIEADRLGAEAKATEEAAEKREAQRLETERLATERKAAEQAQKLEAERLEAERLEAERLEAEIKATEEAARLAEAERKAAEEEARLQAAKDAAEIDVKKEAEARSAAEKKAAEEAAEREAAQQESINTAEAEQEQSASKEEELTPAKQSDEIVSDDNNTSDSEDEPEFKFDPATGRIIIVDE